MRTLAIPVVLLMMSLVFTGWGAPVADTKPQSAVKWAANLEEALAQAEESGKPVLVDVYSDLCYYCSKMHREVFPNRKIIDLSTKFVCVKVNADKRKDVPRKYSVGPLPTYLFLTAKGDLVSQSVGYLPVDPFSIKMQRALELFAAQAELAELKAKREDGTATGAELARLAYLLRRSEKISQARLAANEAIAALPRTIRPSRTPSLSLLSRASRMRTAERPLPSRSGLPPIPTAPAAGKPSTSLASPRPMRTALQPPRNCSTRSSVAAGTVSLASWRHTT